MPVPNTGQATRRNSLAMRRRGHFEIWRLRCYRRSMTFTRSELLAAPAGFTHHLPARFQDCDAAGIVFYARVFDYFHDAYVGSVDGRWRSSDGAYVANGQAVTSLELNGPART